MDIQKFNQLYTDNSQIRTRNHRLSIINLLIMQEMFKSIIFAL